MSIILKDGHIHLEALDYSLESIDQFVKYAVLRNISEINLLDHTHRFIEFKDLYSEICDYNEYQNSWVKQDMKLTLDDYKKLIIEVRKRQYPVKINFGLEVCYVEGKENIIKKAKEEFDWDFLIGSIHWVDSWGFDHKKEFWEGKDVDKVYKRYYETMKNLIKSNLFTSLAHPDSIKCFNYYPSYDLTETYSEIADLLNQYNITTEQNAGLHYRYGHAELGLNKKLFKVFKEKNVKIVTVSDAHVPEDTGKYIKELSEILNQRL